MSADNLPGFITESTVLCIVNPPSVLPPPSLLFMLIKGGGGGGEGRPQSHGPGGDGRLQTPVDMAHEHRNPGLVKGH